MKPSPFKCGPMRTLAPLLAFSIAIVMGPPAWAARPVVVELYTSQGCEPCTKANGLVDELSQREGVLPLTFSVDYWDYLGWADTFAKPEFTARQRAYMRKLGQREVYTPQVVVDGRGQAPGVRSDRIDALIREAARSQPPGPAMRFHAGGFVRVEAGPPVRGGGELWLVRYEPRPEPVEIAQGDNRGQTLAYANVVRELTRLGSWSGRRKTFALPKAEDDPRLKTVILLQGAEGGGVLSAIER